MDRLTFIIMVSSAAFSMFVLGWVAGILYHRIRRHTTADSRAVERLSSQLASVERERDECAETLDFERQAAAEELSKREKLHHQTIDRLRDAEHRLNLMNGDD